MKNKKKKEKVKNSPREKKIASFIKRSDIPA
jgi:hypothetical protein